MFRFSGVKNRILNVRLLKIIEEIQFKFVELAYIYVFIHHVVFYMCAIFSFPTIIFDNNNNN